MQRVALSCNSKRETQGVMASQSACSLPLLRQLGIMDLSRQKLRILGSKEIHAWGGSYQELFTQSLLRQRLSYLELERAVDFNLPWLIMRINFL